MAAFVEVQNMLRRIGLRRFSENDQIAEKVSGNFSVENFFIGGTPLFNESDRFRKEMINNSIDGSQSTVVTEGYVKEIEGKDTCLRLVWLSGTEYLQVIQGFENISRSFKWAPHELQNSSRMDAIEVVDGSLIFDRHVVKGRILDGAPTSSDFIRGDVLRNMLTFVKESGELVISYSPGEDHGSMAAGAEATG